MARIGIDARLTAYRVGGISTYIRRSLQALMTLDSRHDWRVFHSRKARETLTTPEQRRVLWTPAHHRYERLALTLELWPHRLDLLHSPDFIPPQRGARHHVITVHDLTFLHYPQYLTAASRRYYNDQIEAAVRQADHILSDSEATRRDLITMLNVPAEKISVHPLGVDEAFQPLPENDTQPVLDALSLPEAYLLHVGTLEPRKNIVGLVRAYRALLDSYPDAPPLLLVGRRGWLFDAMWQEIEAFKLGERLIWRDDISNAHLPAIYNRARALITPSFYEGFGLPALEAMACGTLPIVSHRSSLPEIVGEVGALIDPDEPATLTAALSRVLNDADWVREQAQRGLERARRFTWDATARIILHTYETILT